VSALRLSAVPVLHDDQRKAIAARRRWLADKTEASPSPPAGIAVAITFVDGSCGTTKSGPAVQLLGALCVLRRRLEDEVER
jgi:hypothetical protein